MIDGPLQTMIDEALPGRRELSAKRLRRKAVHAM